MTRICASLGSADDLHSEDLARADIIEIRTDIFDKIPENILKGHQTGLISFKGDVDASLIPDGWIADIGCSPAGGIKGDVISSHHDFCVTPSYEEIMNILGSMEGDIVKGAFTVNCLKDAVTLLNVARSARRHVIIGMGELGKITRIRQREMRNEFTFAYVNRETAPGQMGISEMRSMGDDCMITGVIGSGIGYTRSPAMHDAGFVHTGINGRYLRFDTPSIDMFREFMTGFGLRGVNITKPYKTEIMEHIDICDRISERIGAVNTVVSDDGVLKGYNTDVYGIEMALKTGLVRVNGKRALILGSGGAARSCAYFLSKNGCDASITCRNEVSSRTVASEFSLTFTGHSSADVREYDIIIGCIPLNKDDDISEYPADILELNSEQIVFDMVYGETHLNDLAERKGCTVVRGEDMLAHQGVKAFELFTGRKMDYDIMRNAV
jgi:shikimate dehydrogenase